MEGFDSSWLSPSVNRAQPCGKSWATFTRTVFVCGTFDLSDVLCE